MRNRQCYEAGVNFLLIMKRKNETSTIFFFTYFESHRAHSSM